ncbi:hypothetical protein CBR_g235 [Chara braunii]|uniref:Uncharacterized protein n=1 Tax=Chara braunii TaxID=69332 RepID=A0A388JM69_CHABU|nr:hypothetical protein CBR_g235 [Chara braunii]|eukprot:GBG58835.1 hypothetical protein CBR_g235 [Chara braunii]
MVHGLQREINCEDGDNVCGLRDVVEVNSTAAMNGNRASYDGGGSLSSIADSIEHLDVTATSSDGLAKNENGSYYNMTSMGGAGTRHGEREVDEEDEVVLVSSRGKERGRGEIWSPSQSRSEMLRLKEEKEGQECEHARARDEQLQHYRSELVRLDARVKGAVSDAASYRAEAARAREERDAAIADARGAQMEVGVLREKVVELQTQIFSAADSSGARYNVEMIESVGRELQERLLQLERENQELKQSCGELAKLATLQKKVEELERQRENLEAELSAASLRTHHNSESGFCGDVKEVSMSETREVEQRRRGEIREAPRFLLGNDAPSIYITAGLDSGVGMWEGNEVALLNREDRPFAGDEVGEVGVREIAVVDDGWEKDWAALEEATSDLKRVQEELGSYKAELEGIRDGKEQCFSLDSTQGLYFANGLKVETSIIDAELEQARVKLEQERGDKLKIQENFLRAEIQVEQYKMQAKQARVEALSLRQQLVIVRAEVEDYKTQMEIVQSELLAVRRENEQMIDELCRKAGEVDDMREKLEGKQKECEELCTEMADMGEEKKRLSQSKNDAEAKIDALKKTVEEKLDRERRLLEELDRAKTESAERLSEVNDLLREKEKWGDRVLSAELAKAGMEKELTEAKAASDAARVEIERLKKDLTATLDKVKRKEDKLAGHLAANAVAKVDKNREVRAEERVKELEARLRDSEKRAQELEAEVEERKGRCFNLELMVKDMERQVKELERERDGYKILVAQHSNSDDALRGELMEAKKEMAAAIAAVNSAHEQSSLGQGSRAAVQSLPRVAAHPGGNGMSLSGIQGKEMEVAYTDRERLLIERGRQLEEKNMRQEMVLRRHEQVIKEQERKLRQMREEEEDRRGQANSMEVALLRTQVEELKHQIRTADKARAENKEMAMKEHRMITAAFYDINLELQRVKHKIGGPTSIGGTSSLGVTPSRSSIVGGGLGVFPGGPGGMMMGTAMSASTSFTSSPSPMMLASTNGPVQNLARPMSAKMTMCPGRMLYGVGMQGDMGGDRGHERAASARLGGHVSAPVSPMGK